MKRRRPSAIGARALRALVLLLLGLIVIIAADGPAGDFHHSAPWQPAPTSLHIERARAPRRLPYWRLAARGGDGRAGWRGADKETLPLGGVRGGAIFHRNKNNNTTPASPTKAAAALRHDQQGIPEAVEGKQQPAISSRVWARLSGGVSGTEANERKNTQESKPPPTPSQSSSSMTPLSPSVVAASTPSAVPTPSMPASAKTASSPGPPLPPPLPPQQQQQPHRQQSQPSSLPSMPHIPPFSSTPAITVPASPASSSSLVSYTSTTTPPPSPPPPLLAATAAAAALLSANNNAQYGNGIFLPLPTVTPPKPRFLDVVSIYANGTTIQRQVRKSELAVELRCPTRDLRLLDTSFPSSIATVLARKNAIVLRMDCLRCVIRRDELILFDPFSKDALALVPLLQQQLATVAALTAAAGKGGATALSPFELLSLEAVLANVCHTMHERLQMVSPHIMRILGDLKFRHGTLSSFPKLLDELLPLRNDLSELHYTVQELRKALNDVLLSDEDMEMMYLSQPYKIHLPSSSSPSPSPSSSLSMGQRSSKHHRGGGGTDESHQEIEMMFENYLMQLEWADTEIREVQHAIRNTEDTVEIQLDLLRNRILRFELVLNIVTSVVSFGCLVTGLFGMNLLSGMEAHPSAFYVVAVVGGVTMAAVLALAFIYGVRSNIF
ncbi:mitochondrial magnesium transporter mrs2p [Nannochloropsis oceanica]